MTVAMDYAALPPEINSARMYAGASSAALLTAASAWSALAAELRSTALSYGAVVSGLADEDWRGSSSAAMAAAVAPYTGWMSTTAAQAEHRCAGQRGGRGLRGRVRRNSAPAGSCGQPCPADGADRHQHFGSKHPGDSGQ